MQISAQFSTVAGFTGAHRHPGRLGYAPVVATRHTSTEPLRLDDAVARPRNARRDRPGPGRAGPTRCRSSMVNGVRRGDLSRVGARPGGGLIRQPLPSSGARAMGGKPRAGLPWPTTCAALARLLRGEDRRLEGRTMLMLTRRPPPRGAHRVQLLISALGPKGHCKSRTGIGRRTVHRQRRDGFAKQFTWAGRPLRTRTTVPWPTAISSIRRIQAAGRTRERAAY